MLFVPKDVPLKDAAKFTVIGTSLPRLDGSDKARGRTIYGIDVRQPGMLYAALVPCPVIGGKVASFDPLIRSEFIRLSKYSELRIWNCSQARES